MEAMVGAVTVSVVDCETPDKLAEIFVTPAETPVARPLALMVASDGVEELHDTNFVISALLPSP